MNETLVQLALACGAARAAALPGSRIVLDEMFRGICKGNACGNYGMCYMCPPDAGEIHALMDAARAYPRAVLYQTIHSLEDSFDYEGMAEAGRRHAAVSQALEKKLRMMSGNRYLHLTLGGCRLCGVCAKREGLPCRHPELALPSLESYGVNVYATSHNAGLPYINGQNTVTYFGMVLDESTEA
jgi:predicted metal-binding protein